MANSEIEVLVHVIPQPGNKFGFTFRKVKAMVRFKSCLRTWKLIHISVMWKCFGTL